MSRSSSSFFCFRLLHYVAAPHFQWRPRVALSGLAHWVLRVVKWHHRQSKAINLFETVETGTHLSKCGVMRFHVICDCLDCKTAIRLNLYCLKIFTLFIYFDSLNVARQEQESHKGTNSDSIKFTVLFNDVQILFLPQHGWLFLFIWKRRPTTSAVWRRWSTSARRRVCTRLVLQATATRRLSTSTTGCTAVRSATESSPTSSTDSCSP